MKNSKELEFKDLRVDEGFLPTFTDISSELKREYNFPNGVYLEVTRPIALSVSKSGGHRILNAFNDCYYIYPDGRWILWHVWDDAPHFVK